MLVPKGKDAEKGFVYWMSTGNYIYVETHEEYESLEKYRVGSFKEVEKTSESLQKVESMDSGHIYIHQSGLMKSRKYHSSRGSGVKSIFSLVKKLLKLLTKETF